MIRTMLCAGLLTSLLAAAAAEAPASGAAALTEALQAAAQDGKPLLVLVRHPWNVATLDAAAWLRRDPDLNRAAAGLHTVVLWHYETTLDVLRSEENGGLYFLAPKGELIAGEQVPALKEDLKPLLDAALRWPLPVDELARVAAADPKDAERLARALHILRSSGRADHALRLLKLAVPTGATPDVKVAEKARDLEAAAPFSAAQRLYRLAGVWERFVKPARPDQRPKVEELDASLTALATTLAPENKEDEPAARAAEPVRAALGVWVKNAAPETEKELLEKLEALRQTVVNRADALRKQATDLAKRQREKDPARPEYLAAELRDLVRNQKDKDAPRVNELLGKLLAAPLDRETFDQAAGVLVYAILWLDLDAERKQLAGKIQREMPRGRAAADVLLDMADHAYAKGQHGEAGEYWKAAEKAAADLQSLALEYAARASRALALGEDSPRHSLWAKREIQDVLLLAPDLETYLDAISRWSHKQFFPVLFQDDLYAPKFAAAFKPAHTLLLPSVRKDGAAAPGWPALRRTVLASWLPEDKKAALPAEATDEQLRARLKELDAPPPGVVFSDGTSGELAGAIALAAGRFQGLEHLPLPKVGADNERRDATPDHYLTRAAAHDLARQVREGLRRWELPRNDRWAAVTLAGAYPFRYSGDLYGRWGTTYALDDLLGRDEDQLRIAATGRLIGDHARSAYQAMCSLFLTPGSAFLFNTYGLNPKSIWGQYRMDFAETAWKDRMQVTHFAGEKASIETFRGRMLPWNRDELVIVNSSGGPFEWSVGGGGGTPEDFPAGGPATIHVTHSGTAGEIYNPDTIAGRALWGGAFWYFGSTAEPFLTSFQPSAYFAGRLASGAPFSATFRQRTAQNFWMPWRLMIAGDPLFCLREKAPERTPWPGAKPHETPAGEDLAAWKARLRLARWQGRRATAGEIAAKWPEAVAPDAEAFAMLIEEALQAGDAAGAIARWKAADAGARKHYAARTYARYAAGSLMDQALAAGTPDALQAHFSALLETLPARNFVDRWLEKTHALARAKNAEPAFETWVNACAAAPELEALKPAFAARLTTLKNEALYKKDKWTAEDCSAAMAVFENLVKAEKNPQRVHPAIEALAAAYLAKVEGAQHEAFVKDLTGRFKADSPESKLVAGGLELVEARRALFKDWQILGAFTDAEAGAWARVGPAEGRTAPDYTRVFKEGEREIKWTRPLNAAGTGIVDLLALLKPNENCYAYAAATVLVEKDCEGLLLLGSDDGITVWLDGREIHRNPAQRGVKPDEDRVKLKLTAGAHALVLRIDQGGGGWGFCARISDASGAKPLPGVTLKCPAP